MFREPTVEGMKLRITSMIWNIRKKKTLNQNGNKKKESKKNEDRLRSHWDIFKNTNIRVTGVPEGEEKEQEIEDLFEKIMKENVPNLVKETDIRVQEAQRVPNKRTQRGPHQDTS